MDRFPETHRIDRIKPSGLILRRPRASRGRLEGWQRGTISRVGRPSRRALKRAQDKADDMIRTMETLYQVNTSGRVEALVSLPLPQE
jgi:hypothetical protein